MGSTHLRLQAMNLTEFFESDDVTLPVGGFEERKETFDTFLRRFFDIYLLQVKDLIDPRYPDICTTVRKFLYLRVHWHGWASPCPK